MNAAKYVGTIMIAAAFVMVGGCDADDYEDEDQFVEPIPKVVQYETGPDGKEIMTFRSVVENGIVTNGVKFNGLKFNGLKFNGLKFNGLKFNGLKFNGTVFNNPRFGPNGGIEAEDGQSNSVEMGESDEVAVDINNEDAAEDYEVKVTEIEDVPGRRFKFQRIRYRIKPSNTFDDVCRDNYNNPVKGILLPYTLDNDTGEVLRLPSNSSVWACRGTATGKCVEWGYHPDDTSYDSRAADTTDLFDTFQACTRMVRADYLGVGQHHTSNGTPIDTADRFGLQTPDTTWQMEAAWGPDGALCLNTPRKLAHARADIETENGGAIPVCGTHDGTQAGRDALMNTWFDAGALLVTLNVPS